MWNENTVLKLKEEFVNNPSPENLNNVNNWERIYVKADKYKGSLRYTTKYDDAEEEKFPQLFSKLSYIEVLDEKQNGFYHATLISFQKKSKKDSCLNRDRTNSKEDMDELDSQEPIKGVIAKIKSNEKVTLQMIKISLEEAQSDKMQIGRPLTFIVHDGQYNSLLSEVEPKSKPNSGETVQLIGIVNLLALLLITSNVHQIILSIKKYGFELQRYTIDLMAERYFKKAENYQTLAAFCCVPMFSCIAYSLEILASTRFPRKLLLTLIVINLTSLLIYPVVISFRLESHPGICAYLMLYTTVTFLKLVSFHHVFHDVRYLVTQVIAAKRANQEMKPSKIEGTIFGINKQVFDLAITYPKCLKFNTYCTFLFGPSCCYQLSYPLIERVRPWYVITYFMEFLASNFVMYYFVFQHVIPQCKESLIHFENKDNAEIFMAVLGIGVPCAYIWLAIFFGLFHAWTNFWGEITRFADRRFYSDWWNAGNLAEYWRKWNYPIHNWLIRHIYYPLVRRGINEDISRLLTFTVSAIFHEYVISGIFRSINMFGFMGMICNIPLMHIQKVLRNNFLSKQTNNLLFWFGYTIVGQPLAIMSVYYANNRYQLYE